MPNDLSKRKASLVVLPTSSTRRVRITWRGELFSLVRSPPPYPSLHSAPLPPLHPYPRLPPPVSLDYTSILPSPPPLPLHPATLHPSIPSADHMNSSPQTAIRTVLCYLRLLPLVGEEIVKVALVPLRGIGGPGALEAGRDRVDALAGAVGGFPGEIMPVPWEDFLGRSCRCRGRISWGDHAGAVGGFPGEIIVLYTRPNKL